MNKHNWWSEINPLLNQKEREISGDKLLNLLLDIEGVDKTEHVSANRSELDRLSIKTFRKLLDKDDPRWRLVFKIQRLTNEGVLIKSQLEHALRADYLSDHQSIRRGFARYIDEVTIPQLARALANIEIGNEVKPKLEQIQSRADLYEYNFEAGHIGNGHMPDSRGVMGCQEALWQLQIFETFFPQLKLLGRIGFNFHWEDGNKIVSIANIQGAPNDPEGDALFEELSGNNFAEALIHSLKNKLPEKEFIFRGIENRPENKVLYKSTFRHTKIPTYRVKRFTNKEYVPSFDDLFKNEIEN